jgi:hypothetical protein
MRFILPMGGIPVLALTVFRASALQLQTASDQLGQRIALDHVGVAVHDLAKAQRDFELLGFTVSEGGHFPGGISNSIIHFEDDGYLERVSATPSSQEKSADATEVRDFLKKHEGAMFLGLNVPSAAVAANYLRDHNFDVEGPTPGSIMEKGETELPPAQWFFFI